MSTIMKNNFSCIYVHYYGFQFDNFGRWFHVGYLRISRLRFVGDRKTALFLIIPATDSTYNFLAAMLYTQMFDVLSNRANFKYGGTLPVHVRCIMDEFANLGEIPDFEKVIAFVRSMGMSLNVIVQNLAQLKARYEKTWEVITGNCDSLLFLGGQEESTLKYMSEALSKETIDVRGFNRTKGKTPSTSENNSILGRELMQQNEIASMPISDCIIRVRSHNPFYCTKYPIENHPNYKFLGDFDKKNNFDVSSVHAVTLREFNQENIEKKSAEIEDTENREQEKKIEIIFGRNEVPEIEFETYEEVELYAEDFTETGDFSEEYADGSDDENDEKFGANSDFESFDLGEPPERKKEVNNDESDTEPELESDAESEESNIENDDFYGNPDEVAESLDEIEDNFEEMSTETTEIYGDGDDEDLSSEDEYALDV